MTNANSDGSLLGPREGRPIFYRLITDPYSGEPSHRHFEWTLYRGNGRFGPYPNAYRVEHGIQLLDTGSGFPRDDPPAKIVYEYLSDMPLRDFETLADTWIISDAARDLLKEYVADSIDIRPKGKGDTHHY